MPLQEHYFQLQFDKPLNVSVQPGDDVYFTSLINSTVSGPVDTAVSFPLNAQNLQYAGTVHLVFESSIVVMFMCDDAQFGQSNNPCLAHLPSQGDFIMFSKDNAVNMTSLLGYYAEVKMVNDSNEKGKLFAVSADVTESSK
mgnify:CR=1 FL=1|tara:strand:- start:2618 stop:3040 length:423 start_codon:yes stop_codon:yes gene_type:complete